MKISYNWLKEMIGADLTPAEIDEALTGAGLEVEGIEDFATVKGGLEGIVIGEVKTCAKHPNADKLSVTTVNIGGEADLQIVCGAPNVAAGQKVLVAPVGTTVHPSSGEPFGIKKAKIRGELSEGMICAEDELGLGSSHDGILVLPDDYVTGKKATEYFPVYTDKVIEIGLTANRGDAASHLGVARDLKAVTGCEIDLPETKLPAAKGELLNIDVEIKDSGSCFRYSGVSISGVSVKESPDWLKNRLKTIGINPINNIVDATNYVLHELGQPLHAFDADRIAGRKIVVKKAEEGQKFTTLDKVERTLNGQECMICDAEKPLAIAGVFGGLDSGISSSTKNIFIESAYFDAASVRKTARFHGLSTDASFRYERGTDPYMTVPALGRVADLITEIAGGEVSSALTDNYPVKIDPVQITFSLRKLKKLIGQEIPVSEVERILTALEITFTDHPEDSYLLTIPPYRVDVKREADVAEEILRIYGLNKIAIPSQLRSTITRSADEDAFLLRNRIAGHLSSSGFYEMNSNSLTKSAYYRQDDVKHAVGILNPLSSDLDIMRMSMLYNGLEMIQYNANRRIADIRSYEYGFTYRIAEGKYEETPHFALFISGKDHAEHWQEPQQEASYFLMKSAVASLLKRAGVKEFRTEIKEDHPVLMHCTQFTYKGELIAEFGSVKPLELKTFDISQPVFYGDVLWKPLKAAAAKQKFSLAQVSSFPSVRRDLALLLDKAVKYADIERIAYKTDSKLIREVNAFDVYEGEKIGEGKKSYAVSFILQDDAKTLTDQEIDSVMEKLQQQYEKELGAVLRS